MGKKSRAQQRIEQLERALAKSCEARKGLLQKVVDLQLEVRKLSPPAASSTCHHHRLTGHCYECDPHGVSAPLPTLPAGVAPPAACECVQGRITPTSWHPEQGDRPAGWICGTCQGFITLSRLQLATGQKVSAPPFSIDIVIDDRSEIPSPTPHPRSLAGATVTLSEAGPARVEGLQEGDVCLTDCTCGDTGSGRFGEFHLQPEGWNCTACLGFVHRAKWYEERDRSFEVAGTEDPLNLPVWVGVCADCEHVGTALKPIVTDTASLPGVDPVKILGVLGGARPSSIEGLLDARVCLSCLGQRADEQTQNEIDSHGWG